MVYTETAPCEFWGNGEQNARVFCSLQKGGTFSTEISSCTQFFLHHVSSFCFGTPCQEMLSLEVMLRSGQNIPTKKAVKRSETYLDIRITRIYRYIVEHMYIYNYCICIWLKYKDSPLGTNSPAWRQPYNLLSRILRAFPAVARPSWFLWHLGKPARKTKKIGWAGWVGVGWVVEKIGIVPFLAQIFIQIVSVFALFQKNIHMHSPFSTLSKVSICIVKR